MYRLLMVWWVGLAVPLGVSSQEVARDWVQMLSGGLAEQRWDEVINFGRMAQQAGEHNTEIDYRMGIAWFRLGQYHRAAAAFQRCRHLSKRHPDLAEFLFYAYLNTGQRQAATTWARGQPETFRRLVNHRSGFGLESMYAETGLRATNWSDSVKTLYFGQLVLSHALHPRVSFTHAYSGLSGGAWWGDFRQDQYYLQASVYVHHGWQVQPFVHLLHLRAKPYLDGGYHVAGINIRRMWNNLEGNLFLSRGVLGAGTVVQYGGRINFYPLHHTGLVVFGSYSQLTRGGITGYRARLGAGLDLLDRFHLRLTAFAGNVRNYHEENGFFLDNGIDLIEKGLRSLIGYQFGSRYTGFVFANADQRREAFFQRDYLTLTSGIGLQARW